jgi:hypothetical protein
MKLTDLAKVVDIGLRLLTQRILTLVGLLMAFSLFCVAISQATWIHLAIAATFAAVVFLPILAAERRQSEAQWQTQPDNP